MDVSSVLLGILIVFGVAEIAALGYIIALDYRARNSFTPGEAAIFKEMRRVLDEAR